MNKYFLITMDTTKTIIGLGLVGIVSGLTGSLIEKHINGERAPELKLKVPVVTHSNDIPPAKLIINRWRRSTYKTRLDISSMLMTESVIWVHLNKGDNIIINSIILTNYRLIKTENGIIVGEIHISRIKSKEHQRNSILHWNKLVVNSETPSSETFGIKHSVAIDRLIEMIDLIKERDREMDLINGIISE